MATDGIWWNNEDDGMAPQSPDLQPTQSIWGKLEMKLDKSFIHSKENLWPELQKDEGTLVWEFLGRSLALPQIDAKGGHSKSTT